MYPPVIGVLDAPVVEQDAPNDAERAAAVEAFHRPAGTDVALLQRVLDGLRRLYPSVEPGDRDAPT